MQKVAKGAVILLTSAVMSWLGAALDHGNWFGWTSNILGIIGLVLGYVIARYIDNYIDS